MLVIGHAVVLHDARHQLRSCRVPSFGRGMLVASPCSACISRPAPNSVMSFYLAICCLDQQILNVKAA